MLDTNPARVTEGRHVHANGIEIHYVQAGEGEPLVLLHGGVVSTSPIWAGSPVAYVSHMEALAQHFRVIAPDTRGCARTAHDGGGPVTFDVLSDDVLALIDALGLERPLLAGFSEGAITASIVSIRRPDAVRAVVNHAGYDFFNPQARSFAIMRQTLGGSPQAARADPDAAARFFAQAPPLQAMFDKLRADQDAARGEGYWREYLSLAFERTTRSPGYTFEDLRRVTAPTLILVGDRDDFCSVDEGVQAYRSLERGELAVLPGEGHLISPGAVRATIDFLARAVAA